jgi:hypothetical protein
MKYVLTLFFILLLCSQYLCAQESGNPANWCRWGTFFIDDWPSYKLVKIKQKTFFYSDEDFKQDKTYLVTNDIAIHSRKYKEYSCVLFPKSETIGWIKSEDLELIESVDKYSKIQNWLGKWKYQDGIEFAISQTSDSKLSIDGQACCFGYGQNVAEIITDNSSKKDNIVAFGDSEDCYLSLFKINDFIVAKDNNQCGGLNATFTGVYTKFK